MLDTDEIEVATEGPYDGTDEEIRAHMNRDEYAQLAKYMAATHGRLARWEEEGQGVRSDEWKGAYEEIMQQLDYLNARYVAVPRTHLARMSRMVEELMEQAGV